MTRSHAAIALVLVAVACTTFGALLAARITGGDDEARVAALESDRAALRERVAEEAAGRAALLLEVERLEAALAAARAAAPLAPAPGDGLALAEPSAATDAPPSPDADDAAMRAAHGATRTGLVLDAERLLGAGFPPQEVERFRARLDELELDRLYLRDQATREGWADTQRFREESRALGQEFLGLREEFDEGLYDWVLYSTGHPNRVLVTEVLSGSAAEAAGLRTGDVIVRYDGGLMLSTAELRDATAGGRAGELVAVEVQREGDAAPLRVFVPRGPLGVRMMPSSVEPPPAR